jgi:hypothetical protein
MAHIDHEHHSSPNWHQPPWKLYGKKPTAMVNHVINMMCICGTLLIDEDVVLRLQKKVHILTSLGRDETTIAE